MGRQDELQRDTPFELIRRNAFEPRKGVVERFRRYALLELVCPKPADAMVLLCDVRELEIECERTKHTRLPLERQPLDRFAKLVVWRAGARGARKRAHP